MLIRRRLCGHALLATLLVGLGPDDPRDHAPITQRERLITAAEPPPAHRVDAPGIENLFRLGPGLYSGAQPEGRQGFESLKQLGVKTILSVDGAWPEVEQARRLGMRYVHLPVGYDGIAQDQVVRLVKTVRSLPGPLFIHCHHGKHRGPTAAALGVMAAEGWSRGQARTWLEQAGTDPKYKGLYATVDQFVTPSAEELQRVGHDDLPDHAQVPGLVASMVRIDLCWDRLTAAQKFGFRSPPGPPELDPVHEATLLAEQFREAARHEETTERGDEFTRLMTDTNRDAARLEAAIQGVQTTASPANKQEAETSLIRMRRHCAACHARFRD
ncbi:Cytochrome C' [Singulisphaera sp. GP187]|uniref:hypothetical protein n=1 Tax=Singulisphaera sp. GP187 TaxID=1882752 RepID=UPI000928C7D8|nr:hypothetical protein [Singulisphaera sp. GP187]SIN70365.1 Cytochrome C' [Singulisphaera sp. GP187]